MPLEIGTAATKIITRAVKGSELSGDEVDRNWTNLVAFVNGLEYLGAQKYDPAYPAVRLNSINPRVASESSFAYGSGTGWGFTHPAGLKFYGQGHADAATNLDKVLAVDTVDGSAGARILFFGRLLAHTGAICVYYRLNGAGSYYPIDARSSDDGGNAMANGFRKENVVLMAKTDSVEFFVAPCDGTGAIPTPVTCRYELEVLALNWR